MIRYILCQLIIAGCLLASATEFLSEDRPGSNLTARDVLGEDMDVMKIMQELDTDWISAKIIWENRKKFHANSSHGVSPLWYHDDIWDTAGKILQFGQWLASQAPKPAGGVCQAGISLMPIHPCNSYAPVFQSGGGAKCEMMKIATATSTNRWKERYISFGECMYNLGEFRYDTWNIETAGLLDRFYFHFDSDACIRNLEVVCDHNALQTKVNSAVRFMAPALGRSYNNHGINWKFCGNNEGVTTTVGAKKAVELMIEQPLFVGCGDSGTTAAFDCAYKHYGLYEATNFAPDSKRSNQDFKQTCWGCDYHSSTFVRPCQDPHEGR